MGAFEHGAPAARPFMRGDASADGVLDVGDAVTVLMHLFASGRPLPPPLEACGFDPTADRLTCEAFPACP